MDPITMMVAGIGMQFFNNYANNKKNREIQEKQREFQKASMAHDFERMRRLQAEQERLTLELEAEMHKERLEDINTNYDKLLDNFAHSFTIDNWPLDVLPFVMKGESFGSLFNGIAQAANLHCIFTPSNCDWFNSNFYDDIDLRLEAEMNNNWNSQSTHPIVYYGGAWNRRTKIKSISVPKKIDLDDIELLRVKLKDVPVVVITPYFDPWLHFKVKIWGMGKNVDTPFRIDIPHGASIPKHQRIFTYDYHKDNVELTAEFENATVDEFTPYLECMIGFIADKYFWSMYKSAPLLPSILQNDKSFNKLMKNSFIERYKLQPDESQNNIVIIHNTLEYVAKTSDIYTETERYRILESLHNKYLDSIGGKEHLRLSDYNFISRLEELNTNKDTTLNDILTDEKQSISENEKMEVWFCANRNELYQRVADVKKHNGFKADKFIYEIKDEFVCIGAFFDRNNKKMYSIDDVGEYVIIIDKKYLPASSEEIVIDLLIDHNAGKPMFAACDTQALAVFYKKKKNWLNKLINRHYEIKQMAAPYMTQASLHNVSFNDLANWSDSLPKSVSHINFALAYDPDLSLYYIVGIAANQKDTFAAYCNTIDEKLIKYFGNNLILTLNK